MVKAPLVTPDIDFGNNVLRVLDAAAFPLSVATWLKEQGDWTLTIGTPLYEELGPKDAYLRLRSALSSEGPISLGELPIRLEGNRSPFIQALRKLFGKAASVEGMRIGGHRIGDTWIEDGYVYRVK